MRVNLKETGYKMWTLDFFDLVQESVVGLYEHNNEPLGPADGIEYHGER
jgi:hypothetical protein